MNITLLLCSYKVALKF